MRTPMKNMGLKRGSLVSPSSSPLQLGLIMSSLPASYCQSPSCLGVTIVTIEPIKGGLGCVYMETGASALYLKGLNSFVNNLVY